MSGAGAGRRGATGQVESLDSGSDHHFVAPRKIKHTVNVQLGRQLEPGPEAHGPSKSIASCLRRKTASFLTASGTSRNDTWQRLSTGSDLYQALMGCLAKRTSGRLAGGPGAVCSCKGSLRKHMALRSATQRQGLGQSTFRESGSTDDPRPWITGATLPVEPSSADTRPPARDSSSLCFWTAP